MKEILYVNTGKVISGNSSVILNSGAIGSCVVLMAYNPTKKIGAMAHIMLPGIAPKTRLANPTLNASNAIDELISQLSNLKINVSSLDFCLVGGANVLKRENDSIGKSNIDSIEEILYKKGITVCAKSVEGFERRTVVFDIEKGCIQYTIGDSKSEILWLAQSMQ